MRLTLHRGVELSVLHSARTEAEHHEELGCSIQGPGTRAVRRAMAPLKREIFRLGRERALEQAGLKTADNGLQFSLRDQSFAGQNNGGGAQPNPAQQLVIPDADSSPVETTQIYSRVNLGGNGIDIRV